MFGYPISGSVHPKSSGGGGVFTASTRTPPIQGGPPIDLTTGNQFIIATSDPFPIAAGQKLTVSYFSEWQATGITPDDVSFFIVIDDDDPGSDVPTGNSFGIVNGQLFRDVLSWSQEFDNVAPGSHVVKILAQSDNGGSRSQINATRLIIMVA